MTFRPRGAVAYRCRSAARRCSASVRAAVPARAGRQQPHVLSARRRARGGGCRRGGHGLHPVDAVRLPARGGQGAPRRHRRGIRCISSADAKWRERGIKRAQDAGFSALVVTIDTPVAGMRERDMRNGTTALLSGNPIAMLPHIGQMLARPRWLAGFPGRRRTDAVSERGPR